MKDLEKWFYPQAKMLAKHLGRPDDELEWKGRIPILVEDAWNHQQKKIDTLETRLKLVKDLLNTEQKVRHQTNW